MPESRVVLALIGLLLTGAGVDAASEVLRDPTRPYTGSEVIAAAPPRFAVNAIIVSDARRIAIVNGKRVAIGGQVNGATVIAIEKTELVLDVDGRKIRLGLHGGMPRNED